MTDAMPPVIWVEGGEPVPVTEVEPVTLKFVPEIVPTHPLYLLALCRALGIPPPQEVEDALERQVREDMEAAGRPLLPAFERAVAVFAEAARQAHALHLAWYPRRHRRCLECHPGLTPIGGPLAVDGREYQRRLRSRRKRNRR